MRLSPALFVIIQFFILLPSQLFILGIVLWFFSQNPYFYFLVTNKGSLLQVVAISVVAPIAGGFFAYQYLERFKAKGKVGLCAKAILAYSIIEVGLILVYFAAGFFASR